MVAIELVHHHWSLRPLAIGIEFRDPWTAQLNQSKVPPSKMSSSREAKLFWYLWRGLACVQWHWPLDRSRVPCGVGLVRCCGGGQVQIMSSLMWRWCRRSHGTSDIFLIIWYEWYSWERERESWGSVLLRWMCWLWLIAHNIRYMLAS